jgi:hypothetical protein
VREDRVARGVAFRNTRGDCTEDADCGPHALAGCVR